MFENISAGLSWLAAYTGVIVSSHLFDIFSSLSLSLAFLSVAAEYACRFSNGFLRGFVSRLLMAKHSLGQLGRQPFPLNIVTMEHGLRACIAANLFFYEVFYIYMRTSVISCMHSRPASSSCSAGGLVEMPLICARS